MFRTNLVVYHQEQKITYCITEFGTLFCPPDDERLNSFETCRADKNYETKLIIRIVYLVGH